MSTGVMFCDTCSWAGTQEEATCGDSCPSCGDAVQSAEPPPGGMKMLDGQHMDTLIRCALLTKEIITENLGKCGDADCEGCNGSRLILVEVDSVLAVFESMGFDLSGKPPEGMLH